MLSQDKYIFIFSNRQMDTRYDNASSTSVEDKPIIEISLTNLVKRRIMISFHILRRWQFSDII